MLKNLFQRSKSAKPLNAPLTTAEGDDFAGSKPLWSPTRRSVPQSSTLPSQDDIDAAIERLYRQDDGQLFAEYAELALESIPKLFAVWQTREGAITRQTPHIVETGNKAVDEACLALLRSPEVREAFPHLLQGVYYGATTVEVLWGQDDEGFYVLDTVPVPPSSLAFDKVTREPLLLPAKRGEEPTKIAELTPKFVVHKPRKTLANPYTRGLAFKLVPYVLMTPQGLRLLAGLLERHGEPIRIGVTPDETTIAPDRLAKIRKKLHEALVKMSSDMSLVLPHGTDVRFEGAPAVNGALHQLLLGQIDELVSTVVLGATLTSGTAASGSSTNALGNVHDTVRSEYAQADAEALSLTLQRQLLRPFVLMNFGEHALVPSVFFSTETARDITSQMDNLTKAHAMGIQFSQREIRELLGMREPEPDEPITSSVATAEPLFPAAFSSRSASFSSQSHAPLNEQEQDEIDSIISEVSDSEIDTAIYNALARATSVDDLRTLLTDIVHNASKHAPKLAESIATAHTCCGAAGAAGTKFGGK